jgi:hypothetical protein
MMITARRTHLLANCYSSRRVMFIHHQQRYNIYHQHQQQREYIISWFTSSNSSTENKVKEENHTNNSTSSSLLTEYLTQAKDLTVGTVDYSIHTVTHLFNALKEMGISQMAQNAESETKNTMEQAKMLEIGNGLESQEAKQSLKTIRDSINDMLYNPQHPINEMKLELSGPKYFLQYLPLFSHVEFLFKCTLYQSLNLIMNIVLYSNVISVQQKEEIVKDVSGIIIKNALDPVSLAVDLIQYISKISNLDASHSDKLTTLIKLLPYVQTALKWIKKIPRP